MPKQTFLNLPEEKRATFIEIALEEFAHNDYNTASISKIVEKAGIAKGSLYQYFKDKQDLFLYLLEYANQVMLEHIRQSPPPSPNADFFDTLRWQMTASVSASYTYPVHSKLAMKAYTASLPFKNQVFDKAKEMRDAHFQEMITQAQSTGQLSPTLDPAVINFMIQGQIDNLGQFILSNYDLENADALKNPEIERIFDQIIQTLKHGLSS